MIEPITPIPLFLVELNPVDYDEYDSAAIACRNREILDELLDGAFARYILSCSPRVAYKYGFEIGSNQHVTSVTEIGTYTLGIPDGDAHFFSEDHANVLNVEFDDITEDIKVFDGEEYGFPGKLTARGITPETAEKIVRFIEDHKGMDFLIHCRAGKSRSQGVVRYVLDFYKGPFQTNQSNPCRFYNTHTYTALRKARERLGLC